MATPSQQPFSPADGVPQPGTNDINLERRIIVENRRQQELAESGAEPGWLRDHLDVVFGVGFVILMVVGIVLLATA